MNSRKWHNKTGSRQIILEDELDDDDDDDDEKGNKTHT